MIKNPVCSLFITILIIIFSLYFTNIIKNFTCNKNLVSTFYSNFVHIDHNHLISNIVTFYSLSTIESKMGSKNFFYLIVSCLFFNTILETYLHHINKNLKCSIGISGLLISIIVFDSFIYKEINSYLIISLFMLVFYTPIKYECISIYGHFIGFISGLICVILFKFFYQC